MSIDSTHVVEYSLLFIVMKHKLLSVNCTVEYNNFDTLLILSSGEAVFARCLSSLKDDRVAASKALPAPPGGQYTGDKKEFIEHIRQVGTKSYIMGETG